jgi:hypothetical protein
LLQERRRPDGGGDIAGDLDRDASSLGQRQERFGCFFRDKRQVNRFSGKGTLIGPAECEQRFRKFDGPGVDRVEAIDEFAGIATRILAGELEESLRNSQGSPQFM